MGSFSDALPFRIAISRKQLLQHRIRVVMRPQLTIETHIRLQPALECVQDDLLLYWEIIFEVYSSRIVKADLFSSCD